MKHVIIFSERVPYSFTLYVLLQVNNSAEGMASDKIVREKLVPRSGHVDMKQRSMTPYSPSFAYWLGWKVVDQSCVCVCVCLGITCYNLSWMVGIFLLCSYKNRKCVAMVTDKRHDIYSIFQTSIVRKWEATKEIFWKQNQGLLDIINLWNVLL